MCQPALHLAKKSMDQSGWQLEVGGGLGKDASMLTFLFWRVSVGRRRSPPSGAVEGSRGEPRVRQGTWTKSTGRLRGTILDHRTATPPATSLWLSCSGFHIEKKS
jgi:hypothetical protein